MKKLFLLGVSAILLTSLMLSSFKTARKHNWKSGTSITAVSEALNGFSQSAADQMVKNTISENDSTPANTEVWFSKRVVDSVFSLLQQDSLAFKLDSTSGIKQPDGIRIYFGSTTPTATVPLHYNNNIIVVSTYFNGVDTLGPHNFVEKHHDYFSHPQTAGLFSLDSVGGVVTNDHDTSNGALLYIKCNCDTIKPCITTSDHDILRSIGEKMVQSFPGEPIAAIGEWFDIGMLRNLVQEMNDENDDGIRIYFARGVSGINQAVDVGKGRFVIVTTKQSKNPLTNAAIHKDYFDCVHPITVSVRAPGKPAGPGQNNGELCPNNCNGATLP